MSTALEAAPDTEAEVEVSMDDSLRDGYRKFRADNPEPDTDAKPDAATGKEPAAEAVSTTPAAPPTRERDADGKFAVADATAPADATTAPAKRRPPTTWRKEALAKWESLDPLVQDEIEKRENDAMNGINSYKAKGDVAELWERAIAPYQATLQSMGVAPQKAAQQLFAADHAMRYGNPQQKAAMIHKLVKDYGIQMEGLPEPEQEDPRIAALNQKVEGLETMQKHQQRLTADRTLDEFSKNAPHLDAVKEQMAAMLETGMASSLQDAYDKAVWSKAELRDVLIAEQQKGKTDETARIASEARKAAAVNVPTTGKVAAGAKQGSMDDDLKAGVRRLGLFQ